MVSNTEGLHIEGLHVYGSHLIHFFKIFHVEHSIVCSVSLLECLFDDFHAGFIQISSETDEKLIKRNRTASVFIESCKQLSAFLDQRI